MSDKMIRFLNSIKIENIDDFDLDFELLGRHPFDKDVWNMVIVKKTPWKYNLLNEFQNALQNITYKYKLRFSYLTRPNCDDVIHLLDEWYQSIYHVPHNMTVSGDGDYTLTIEYENQSEKEQYSEIIKDFRDFIDFLSYEFEIVERINPNGEDYPELSKRAMNKIVKEAHEAADETMQELEEDPEIRDRNDVIEMIEEQHKEEANKVEESLLEMMRQNAAQMKKERERARLNRRGNYTPVENIDSITANSGNVDFSGKIFSLEVKEFAGKKRLTFGIADDKGGAIYASSMASATVNDENKTNGSNVRVRGVAYVDDFTHALQIKPHFIDLLPPDVIEKEPFEKNRVELHVHTKMSQMDAVTDMEDYCAYAEALGHTAMAITDHAVVQGYPDAQKAAKKHNIKMLYGTELYVVNDKLSYIKNPCKTPISKARYVVLDLETTGLSCRYDRIIEFGAVRVENGIVTSRLDILIDPKIPLTDKISELTGITEDMVKGQPGIREAMPKILEFMGNDILVTHNADFDFSFLQETLKNLGLPLLTNPVIDTLSLSRYLFPEARRHNLGSLCRNMDVEYDEESAHRADYDAEVLNDVWQPMIVTLTKNNPNLTHEDLGNLEVNKSLLKHLRPYHACVLVKNKEGLKDLYKLVSLAHVEYLSDVSKTPNTPRSALSELRKNLLIGSACFNGDVFDTARTRSKEVLKQVISFYDYIEIQPLENYSYLVDMGELDQEEVIRYVKDIVECADELGIPVCATGDVHYLSPREKIFRDVYISAKGLGGASHPLNPYSRAKRPRFENPNQHYRTTKEMLDAMNFLGEEKALEVTITNTNLIADMCESLVPLPNDHLYTPTIENCEETLRKMCYDKAHELYGDPLPELIEQRLETELNGIIGNGYSVIYYIAYKLVHQANEDGYIVGSRGSVGSSLVATMCDITEVNSLPPHYRCPHCKHLEWTSETMPEIKSGYDLPEKKCPICGADMVHDGQNIPFQTFLGFNADKVPDIDLNFPGDYQATAHNYTKVFLGETNVYRAGTISGVEEKTAFGFARGYIERLGMNPDEYSKAKISYIASGCVGVKRTTGQHPGGIVVIPAANEVYDFTPVQYPADDMDANWKTTHFDFHSIHDTILKLDMLGHVDPMALKMMCDLTGIPIKKIPLNDKKVLSLFSCPDALEMNNTYLGAKTGAMAIPEFGTSFVRGILEETRPKTFSDLVIISGISHGTDVWQGNAEELIKNGTATLQEVIGCRDDIMTYLIDKGLPKQVSFSIMEDVRKGRGLKPEYVDIMKANKVPQYYLDSCNKIKYMFPKGHAVAYVTMAIRVGYFKIYYPLEFYATFFTVRSKQYDIDAMIGGREKIIARLEELNLKNKTKGEKLSPKEADQLKTLNIALEMVERGYKFENIDLYRSDASRFVVDKENKALVPPFICLDGLGESAAATVIEARKEGEFYSKEDLLRRTKLSSTNVNDLSKLGVLDNLNDTDQLSLFDF